MQNQLTTIHNELPVLYRRETQPQCETLPHGAGVRPLLVVRWGSPNTVPLLDPVHYTSLPMTTGHRSSLTELSRPGPDKSIVASGEEWTVGEVHAPSELPAPVWWNQP